MPCPICAGMTRWTNHGDQCDALVCIHAKLSKIADALPAYAAPTIFEARTTPPRPKPAPQNVTRGEASQRIKRSAR